MAGILKLMKRLFSAIALLLAVSTARAETPPPSHVRPDDKRLARLVDLNGYFPFVPASSPVAWQQRAERLRRQLLVAAGLWPMPARTPPQAVVHGKVVRDGYTVEKVYLQSYPGHFVTGSLYRPVGRSGRLPAVLSPHGHWAGGRFYDVGETQVQEDIAAGAEHFEIGGRYPLQARCVQLARMGCIVFHYDMVGYADSVQLAHRAGVRKEMNAAENWGYYSPQAELRLQSVMGLQTYNSIRALDWLSSLPEVDPARIAVTGASGGGTQTLILCAIDPRPAVAFPAVMVSTAMQGGCSCENASYLRIGTGNVEIAALIAPRPLGMTAADDWTKELAAKGLPELKQHYRMLGVEDRVMAAPLLQFPHNFNYASRAVMYQFLNRHLKLGLPEPIVEADYRPLTVAEMSVWDKAHPKPPSGDEYERSLLREITAQSEQQMADLIPTDKPSLAKYRRVVGGAVDVLIGRGVPLVGEVQPRMREGGMLWLRNRPAGEEVRVRLYEPMPAQARTLVIWVDKEGGLAGPWTDLAPTIQRFVKADIAVMLVDLFGQNESSADGKPITKNRLSASGRGAWAKYAGYTYGYNYPLFAQRVHDILTAVGYARNVLKADKVYVVGLHGAGHWVAAARAQAGAAIDRAVVDTAAFRFANVRSIDDADFLPGGAKYLDLPGMLALSAPYPLWLAGEGDKAPPVVEAAYRATGTPNQLTVFSSGSKEEMRAAAIKWLLQ
jgi:dienelactone hydrolase